ncbi:MAG: ATP-binding protein [Candidatus Melainabacteria bacterium]|nr:ATP-binding protein [Candidatus Melainabacteria bacterium]
MTQTDMAGFKRDTPSLWSRFLRISLENKVLLLVILFISVAFFVGAMVIYGQYQVTLKKHYEQFGQLLTAVVSAGGEMRLNTTLSPELRLQSFVDSVIAVSTDVAAIEFYDPQGTLIYQSYRDVSPELLANSLDFVAPIKNTAGQAPLGQVHVKLTGETMRDLANATKTIVVVVFVFAWIISILALLSNTYVQSKCLRQLVRGVQRLSTGDFGYKIADGELWGELKVLAEAFNDMSERLRAYEDQNLDTLTFERNKLEAMLLSIADGVLVCDTAGVVSIVNQPACQMLGVGSPDVLMGAEIRDYVTIEGDRCFVPLLAAYEAKMAELSDAAEGLSASHAKPAVSKRVGQDPPGMFSYMLDLSQVTVKVMVSSIQDANGNVLGRVMILHDVTKEAEVDKLKTNFISNVSHELRTPVTTIKSYVDTIYNHGKELDADTYQEFIETIHLETDRLKKLVNDILDFSRLEAGTFQLDKSFEEITPVINLTVQSVKVLAEKKNLTLTTALESNLPKVSMNSESIERVLRNLLSNAIKYTPEGGRIKVRAEVVRGNRWLEVSVEDTGVGISEEHLPFIFDRFYRVENKVHTVKGTGLGLHLVKVAIENHHQGEVFVQSAVGTGSTFGFRLPVFSPKELTETQPAASGQTGVPIA